MSFKIIADTFSVARDSEHFIQLKTLKKPRFEEQVWMVVEVAGETKYARATVQNIFETIEEIFFAESELSPYERFESTLKEVNLVLKNLKEKRGPKAAGEISAILAVFQGENLYLTQSKNAEAYLIRRGKLSMISEGLTGRSEDLFTNIASGELMVEDKIIFSTARLLRLATQSQLVQLMGEGVTEAVDSLRELSIGENEFSVGVMCLHLKLAQRTASLMSASEGTAAFLGRLGDLAEKAIQWIAACLSGRQAKAGLPDRQAGLPAGQAGNKIPLKSAREARTEKRGDSSFTRWLKDHSFNFNRKGVLIALAAAVVILGISVSLLMDSRRNEALRREYRQRIEAMNQDLIAANTKGYADQKETANAILDKIEQEGGEILGANYFRDEVLLLLEKVQAARDNINNTIRLKDPKPYVDLGLKNPALTALGVLRLSDKFFVYELSKLYEVILDQVLDPKILESQDMMAAGTAMEDQDVLVFLTQSGRVLEYAEGRFSFPNTDDTVWQKGVDLAAYGRHIYLLSPEKNQIYKYSRTRGQYSPASEYNADATLDQTISLAIDGNIYALKKGGEIIKLFKSKVQPFKIEDLAADLSSASQIFTTPDIAHLYFLDTVNQRVTIVEKDKGGIARYVGQVVFDALENVKDFYVDQTEDKLYLLTEKAIYQVDI